ARRRARFRRARPRSATALRVHLRPGLLREAVVSCRGARGAPAQGVQGLPALPEVPGVRRDRDGTDPRSCRRTWGAGCAPGAESAPREGSTGPRRMTSVVLPQGFQAGGIACGIKRAQGSADLGLLLASEARPAS